MDPGSCIDPALYTELRRGRILGSSAEPRPERQDSYVENRRFVVLRT
jgi:hypothetical protein